MKSLTKYKYGISGIYKFTCLNNGRIYIGCSECVLKRKENHVTDLRKGIHHNIKFQRAFNKYGESAFQFEVIEECSKDQLIEREQHYLNEILFANDPDKFKKLGFNISPIAGRNVIIHSEKTKKLISEKNKGRQKSESESLVLSEMMKERWSMEDYRVSMSKMMKDLWQDATYQKKQAASKVKWTKKRRKEKSTQMKNRWSDPDYHKKVVESRLEGYKSGNIKTRKGHKETEEVKAKRKKLRDAVKLNCDSCNKLFHPWNLKQHKCKNQNQ